MPLVSVPNDALREAHMDLVDRVNAGTLSQLYLDGWRDGVRRSHSSGFVGMLLMDADEQQMARGEDGPMCGGILLKPTAANTVSESHTCPTCRGRTTVFVYDQNTMTQTCPTCHGTGRSEA